MSQAQEIRQRLLDIVVDIDGWYAQQQELEDRVREANERAQRLDNERLGATLRLETELQRSTVEYLEKVEALEGQIRGLVERINAQNAEIKDAVDRFAKELEVRPDSLAALTVQAVTRAPPGERPRHGHDPGNRTHDRPRKRQEILLKDPHRTPLA